MYVHTLHWLQLRGFLKRLYNDRRSSPCCHKSRRWYRALIYLFVSISFFPRYLWRQMPIIIRHWFLVVSFYWNKFQHAVGTSEVPFQKFLPCRAWFPQPEATQSGFLISYVISLALFFHPPLFNPFKLSLFALGTYHDLILWDWFIRGRNRTDINGFSIHRLDHVGNPDLSGWNWWSGRESNPLPGFSRTSKAAPSIVPSFYYIIKRVTCSLFLGAKDGAWTRNVRLGRPTFHQLNYLRVNYSLDPCSILPFKRLFPPET